MRHIDRIVLITGGTRGIGLETARVFHAEGAKVIVAARHEAGLQNVQSMLPDVETHVFDAFSETSREALIESIRLRHGRLDVLINNAGQSFGANASQTTMEAYRQAMEINFFAPVDLSLRALSLMKEGSVIVQVASIWGREAGGKAAYNASKAALISFTKALGDDLAGRGIRVVGVAPGSIRHPGGSWDRRYLENPEQMEAFIAQHIPAGRFGTAEEVARVIAFLASSEASWIMGTTVVVDGGQSKMF